MVDAANQGWMAPFAVVLLAGGHGAVLGRGGAGSTGLLSRREGPRRVLVFAGLPCPASNGCAAMC